MENVVQEEVIVDAPTEEKSTVLSEEEVQATLSGEEPQSDVSLPSESDFEMPDKFKGKSAEEIARAYAELEKMKAQPDEEAPEEDKPTEESDDSEYINPILEEGRPEGSQDVPADQFVEFVNEFDKNGQLSEDSYQKLQELGYSKEFVNEKIDYIQYKRERDVESILEPNDRDL